MSYAQSLEVAKHVHHLHSISTACTLPPCCLLDYSDASRYYRRSSLTGATQA